MASQIASRPGEDSRFHEVTEELYTMSFGADDNDEESPLVADFMQFSALQPVEPQPTVCLQAIYHSCATAVRDVCMIELHETLKPVPNCFYDFKSDSTFHVADNVDQLLMVITLSKMNKTPRC